MKTFNEYLTEDQEVNQIELTEATANIGATVIKSIQSAYKLKGTFKATTASDTRLTFTCDKMAPEYQAFGDKMAIDVALKPNRANDDMEGTVTIITYKGVRKASLLFAEIEIAGGKVRLFNV